MPQYLQKRRRKWYAVLAIPKAIQVNFGKAKFIKSLETDSLSVAERKVQPIILEWKREIELAKGNETTGSELLESVRFVRRDAQRMRAEGETDEDIKYVHEDIAYSRSWNPDINDFQTNNEELAVAVSVVHGSEFLLSEHIDEYLNSKTTAEKTKDQVRRDLIDYTERFELAQNVTRLKMVEWANVVLGSERGLEIVTCRRIVSSCRGYWKWLVLNKNLELPPPFDDVLPPKSKKKSKADIAKKRKAFRARHPTPCSY